MNALVTGITGFVGGALARRLVAEGWMVTGLGRNRVIGSKLEQLGVQMIYGDLSEGEVVRFACDGQHLVFHCGGLSAAWGNYQDFYRANLMGTRHIVETCVQHKGIKLIHVSTPSIYFGYRSRLNVTELGAIPAPVNAYVNTKWAAEKIIQMHRHGVQSIVLRPRAIFGEGDTSLLPRILPRLKQGRLPIIGDGTNLVDLTYIDNVVEALWLAAHAPDTAWGRAYNITNGESVLLWNVITQIAEVLGYPAPTRHIPAGVAFRLAGVLEGLWRMVRLPGEPPLTRFAVAALANSTTLDITAAQEWLGYIPVVEFEAGLQQTINHYRTIEA